jgi:hypothetical protein
MVAEAARQLGGLYILVNIGSAPGGSPTATDPIETVIDEGWLQISVQNTSGAALFPRCHPFHEDGGLGPYHQHQRRQRPQRRPSAHDEGLVE